MSMACVVALNLGLYGEDLGKISVESSTINDNYETKKSEVSSSVVITGEQVTKINPTSISDLLRTIPGLTQELTGTDSVKVHIRGVNNQMYMGEQPGVAIVIDGVSVQETAGKINVDLDNIESIKVIKGGASYLYGNDAIAGAIVITTKNPKGQKDSSKIETEAGSFGTKRFLASTNQAFETGALQLQGAYRDTDGYWDDAFVTEKTLNGKYQYYINDNSDITFGSSVDKRQTGDGNSVSGTIAATTNPTSIGEYSYSGYYDTTLTKSFVTYSNDIDDSSNFLLRLHKYEDDKTYKTARATTAKDEIWNQNGLKAEYKKDFKNFALMIGTDIQRNDTDEKSSTVATGVVTATYETKEDINALYTEVKYQINDKLSSTANLRHDSIKHDYMDKMSSSKNVSPTYSANSYRIGANYDFSVENSIYASLSTGFRAPTVGQISTNQVYLAANPTADIQATLDIEKTYNYELGFRGKTTSLNYEASAYQLDRKDYIGKIAGSYISDADAENNNYGNVGDMRSRGFELSVGTQGNEKLGFNLAYTYLDAKFTNYVFSRQMTDDGDRYTTDETFVRTNISGNQVPRSSKHKVNLTVDYRPTSSLTISPELVTKSSYYADEMNLQKQKGYEVVNLRAEYKLSNSLEFFGKIDNLMDKTYYEFVNLTSAGVKNTMENDATIRVAAPRAYYAGLRYKF
jgi:iron complex outermembrane receptor protein